MLICFVVTMHHFIYHRFIVKNTVARRYMLCFGLRLYVPFFWGGCVEIVMIICYFTLSNGGFLVVKNGFSAYLDSSG